MTTKISMRRLKLKLGFVLTLFFSGSFLYGVWLLWKKLTDVIGSSNLVLAIVWGIIVAGIFLGYL